MNKVNKIKSADQLTTFTRSIEIEARDGCWPVSVIIAKYRAKYAWSHSDYNQVVAFFAAR
jgi:hypothetical protein